MIENINIYQEKIVSFVNSINEEFCEYLIIANKDESDNMAGFLFDSELNDPIVVPVLDQDYIFFDADESFFKDINKDLKIYHVMKY